MTAETPRPTMREEIEQSPALTAFRDAVAIMDRSVADLKARTAQAETRAKDAARERDGLLTLCREIRASLTVFISDGCPCRREFVCTPHRLLALLKPVVGA